MVPKKAQQKQPDPHWSFSPLTIHSSFPRSYRPLTCRYGDMSTRSRAKPGVESKSTSNVRLKSRGNAQHDDMDVDGTGKENNISRGSAKPAKKQRKTAKGKDSVHSRKSIDCICSKGDDGSPMILCSECKIWYVFILPCSPCIGGPVQRII